MTVADANPVTEVADVKRANRSDRAFLGHPKGLGFLAFAEGCERFSYYGMQALLVIYMTDQLLRPGHVENVAFFEPFRSMIQAVTGPLAPEALATMIGGLYSGFVYLTPILGGIIADRLLGRTRSVTLGAVLMAIGHFLMAFEVSFILALLCLLLGVGLFKGNIATQVGELYKPEDLRRADAFQIFLLAVNIAVIAGSMICGWLGEKVGYHYGFAAAGVLMLIGLVIYLWGRRWLPAETPPGPKGKAERPPFVKGDMARTIVLVLIIPLLTLAAVGNQTIFGSYLLWGRAHYDLVFFGQSMPVTWLISLDAIISTGTIILSILFWRWWAKRWREPQEITKLTIGVVISALAPLALAVASWQSEASGQKVGIVWGFAFHIINDIGFANVFPVGIALYSRASPRAIAGTMIGVYYLHLFACNLLVGRLGGFLATMEPGNFWLMHAALVGAGALGLLLVRSFAGRILAPFEPEPALAPA